MANKVIHEKELCIGCGACASVCEKFWRLGSEGKAELKGSKIVGKNNELAVKDMDLACNKTAADTCPVNCIHVFEKDKKLI